MENLRVHTGPGGGVTEYRYTAMNLLAALVQPGGATTSYGYDADNNRTTTTYPGAVVVTHVYNAAGQRLRLSQCDRLGTLVGSAVGIATPSTECCRGRSRRAGSHRWSSAHL